MKSKLRKRISKPFNILVRKATKHVVKNVDQIQTTRPPSTLTLGEIPGLGDNRSSLGLDISNFMRSSSSLVAIPRSSSPIPRPPVPTIVVTTSSPPHSLVPVNRASQVSLSPFDFSGDQSAVAGYSPYASSAHLSQLSDGMMSKDLDNLYRRMNQEFDSLREEIRMLKQLKERSDRAYEAEIDALRHRVDVLESGSSPRRRRGRIMSGQDSLRLVDCSSVLWEDIGRQYCASPVEELPLSISLPYDPTRRCAVSAEKLLASATTDIDPAAASEDDAENKAVHSTTFESASLETSFASSSLSTSNSIPFPSLSPPSSPVPNFTSFFDYDDTMSSITEIPEEKIHRLSMVSLPRKKYQNGEDQFDRRALSTPIILPSQIGMASLEASFPHAAWQLNVDDLPCTPIDSTTNVEDARSPTPIIYSLDFPIPPVLSSPYDSSYRRPSILSITSTTAPATVISRPAQSPASSPRRQDGHEDIKGGLWLTRSPMRGKENRVVAIA